MNDAMYLLPLLAAFFLILLDVLTLPQADWKWSYLKTVVLFSTLLVLITEILSAFHTLNRTSIFLAWTLVSVVVFLHIRPRFSEGLRRLVGGLSHLNSILRRSHPLEKAVMLLLALLVSMLAVQAIIYPVNNNDSLTYHMPRIVSWISQESVEHYRTTIYRQLYQPPFSEFFNLHVSLLLSSDVLCNSLQLLFLLSCLVPVMLLLDEMGVARHMKLVSVALVLTIPMALLQSTNTKSDIVLSFFVLSAVCYSVRCMKKGRLHEYLFLGLSFGLAMLTKGTSSIFLAPMILPLAFAALRRMVKEKSPSVVLHAALAALVCLMINAGHFSRNYTLTGNVVGLDASESNLVSNEKMTPKYLLSNMLKNIGRQAGPPPFNKYYDKFLVGLHQWLDIPVNNPYTNFDNIPYSGAPSWSNYEENVPNYMHLYLFLFSVVLLGYNIRVRKTATSPVSLLIVGVILLQFVLFSALLKWQPWHSRLLVSIFMLTVPFVCYVIGVYTSSHVLSSALVMPFIFFGMNMLVSNRTRPLNLKKPWQREMFQSGRFSRQFMATDKQEYLDYKAVREAFSPMKDKRLGLIINEHIILYTLLRDTYDSAIHPIYVNAENPSRKIGILPCRPEYILSNTIRKTGLGFSGAWYQNATPANKFIWLYRLSDTAYRR